MRYFFWRVYFVLKLYINKINHPSMSSYNHSQWSQINQGTYSNGGGGRDIIHVWLYKTYVSCQSRLNPYEVACCEKTAGTSQEVRHVSFPNSSKYKHSGSLPQSCIQNSMFPFVCVTSKPLVKVLSKRGIRSNVRWIDNRCASEHAA